MTDNKSLTFGQWMVLVAAFLGWMFDGVEIGLFPLVARPALQELLAEQGDKLVGTWNGYIAAAFLLGAALGGLVFGWLGDRIGRVWAMIVAILTYSLFTGAGALAWEAWQLAVLRFIASLGMGGEWAVAVALVVECWPERHRPKLAGAIGAAANVGFLLIGMVAYFFPETAASGWRWLMVIGASPALLCLFIIFLVPESEKWKESRKTAQQAPVLEIFSPGLRKSTILGIILSGIPLIGTWAAVSGWTPLWVEQIRERELVQAARPDVPIAPNEPASAHLARLPEAERKAIGREAARSKAFIQIVLAIGAIIGCYVAPLIAQQVGRRPAYYGLCLVSLVSCALLYRGPPTVDVLFIVTVSIVGAVTAAFYGWLPLYLPELFPTRVRATGQGLSFNFGRILAAFGAVQMGALVSALGGNYATAGATITLIYAVGLVAVWFGPETKDQALPD